MPPVEIRLESWRDVPGYDGLYQVSDFGRVKSFHRKGRIMKNVKTSHGYLMVNLSKDGRQRTHLVHALVRAAFAVPLVRK